MGLTRDQFREAVTDVWGSTLAALESIIINTRTHVDVFLQDHASQIAREDEPIRVQFYVLARMACRGCQLSDAILILLREGHADTAFGVWRTLQEIQMNSSVIAQDNSGMTARRFNDWGIGVVFRRERLLRESNSGEMDEDDYKSITQTYARMIDQYGQDYKQDSGWSSVGMSARAKKIGKVVDYSKYYKAASSYVHADIVSHKLRIGISEANKDKYLFGPSGIGLDLPALMTALSLPQIAHSFMFGTRFATEGDEKRIARSLKMTTALFRAIDSIDSRNRAPFREGEKLFDRKIFEELASLD